MNIEKQIRQDTPQVSVAPYKQIHAHSTGNPSSTAQNEADYMNRKDLSSGFFTHVVGNGRIIQTARTNRGAWDVGGSWNNKTYSAVELIESHKTKDEFLRDYKLYVELLRQLAKENNIPIKVDAGAEGINTHYYCTNNQPNNKSDHTDPYPYLQKWGISKTQFKKDVESGSPSSPEVSAPPTSGSGQIGANLTNKVTYQKVDADGTRVRTSQTTNSAIVDTLAKGTVFRSDRYADGENVDGKGYKWFERAGKGWVYGGLITPTTAPSVSSWVPQKGKFKLNTAIKLRSGASTNSAVIATLSSGSVVNYDAYIHLNGYVWIRQPRGNGYGYLATGESVNGKRKNYWGTFY